MKKITGKKKLKQKFIDVDDSEDVNFNPKC